MRIIRMNLTGFTLALLNACIIPIFSVLLFSCSSSEVEIDTDLFLGMIRACDDYGFKSEQCYIWNKDELTELNQSNWKSAISMVLESDFYGVLTGSKCWKEEACMFFDMTTASQNSFQNEIIIDLLRKEGRWYLFGVTFSADPEKVEGAITRICSQYDLSEDEQKNCLLIGR